MESSPVAMKESGPVAELAYELAGELADLKDL